MGSVEDFNCGRVIDGGGYGIVYEGTDPTGRPVAIKKELVSANVTRPTLPHEHGVYRSLGPHKSLPAIKAYGIERVNPTIEVLVMDKLGSTLAERFLQCGKRFSMPTMALLGLGMLDAIEHVHSKGFLHRDLQPGNFLLGREAHNSRRVHLIDFGLARRFHDPVTRVHAPPHDSVSFMGTFDYASLAAHLGNSQSRRDDLQGISYILVKFARGGLPWSVVRGGTHKNRLRRITKKKEEWPPKRLCAELPELLPFVTHCFDLEWEEEPDWGYLRNGLTGILKNRGEDENCMYDWEKPGWRPIHDDSSAPHKKSVIPLSLHTPISRGDVVLLQVDAVRTLDLDAIVQQSQDPSFSPHLPLAVPRPFPFRPAMVTNVVPSKTLQDSFTISVYPLMKRTDRLDSIATERRKLMAPLNVGNSPQLSATGFWDVFAYKPPLLPTPIVFFQSESSSSFRHCVRLPESVISSVEQRLKAVRCPNYGRTYHDDDAETLVIRQSMPREWTHPTFVMNAVPFEVTAHTNDGKADWTSVNAWMEEMFAVNRVQREENGESDSDSDSEDSDLGWEYHEWPKPGNRRLSCTVRLPLPT